MVLLVCLTVLRGGTLLFFDGRGHISAYLYPRDELLLRQEEEDKTRRLHSCRDAGTQWCLKLGRSDTASLQISYIGYEGGDKSAPRDILS